MRGIGKRLVIRKSVNAPTKKLLPMAFVDRYVMGETAPFAGHHGDNTREIQTEENETVIYHTENHEAGYSVI